MKYKGTLMHIPTATASGEVAEAGGKKFALSKAVLDASSIAFPRFGVDVEFDLGTENQITNLKMG